MSRKPLASQVAARLQHTKPHLFLSKKQKEFLSSSRNQKPKVRRIRPGEFEIQGRKGIYRIIDGSCNCPGAWYQGKCWHLPAVRKWAKENPYQAPVPPQKTGKPIDTKEYIQSGIYAKDLEAYAEAIHLGGEPSLSLVPRTIEQSMQELEKVMRSHQSKQKRLLKIFQKNLKVIS